MLSLQTYTCTKPSIDKIQIQFSMKKPNICLQSLPPNEMLPTELAMSSGAVLAVSQVYTRFSRMPARAECRQTCSALDSIGDFCTRLCHTILSWQREFCLFKKIRYCTEYSECKNAHRYEEWRMLWYWHVLSLNLTARGLL